MTAPKNTPQKKNHNNNQMAELRHKLSQLENQIKIMEEKNKNLEARVDELESVKIISANVNDRLVDELDRLDQYSRRSNLIIRNVFLPEKETNEEITNKITKVINKDMNLPEAAKDIDKLHRVGKIKTANGGKKKQDVIVRFRSHASRYAVYGEKHKLRNYKIGSNLTKRRGSLLYDASQLTDSIDAINFVYADIHGNLKVRLINEYKGKHVFPFNSIDMLDQIITEVGNA